MAMKLIHRDSVPHLNSKARVPATHIEHLADISSARFMYLQHLIDKELSNSEFQVNVQQAIKTSLFFVNFSVGQPPVPQYTIMDSGSSLLWIKCLPCKHCSADDMAHSVFNPALSSTFEECSCNDPLCRYAPNAHCGSSNKCLYEQVYIAGAGSKGVVAKERLTFTTPNGNTVLTEPMVFGCGHENGAEMESEFTGILGLGAKPTSLAVQLGSKFSYCMGDLANKNYGYNQLVLGEDADILGDPTPIETDNGVYYMNLEGISVGEKQLSGAELAMEATSMFYPLSEFDNVFCMAVKPTTEHGWQYKEFTAIGLMAQQYYNIAYDLKEKNVYLQRIDCVLLDDSSPSR
ncbi:hypothetical protein AALP_AA6G276400 [Arabis alpina]|uniref:Peptidase A1 domain-containing protein n=1 Tax=Arabis alpina TaxID=50452 RepID=A0A087GS39_ARAAL|nr:hypothetical protein AALP_AA6G276400 [Arabis alpina]